MGIEHIYSNAIQHAHVAYKRKKKLYGDVKGCLFIVYLLSAGPKYSSFAADTFLCS
jgi:hypothetical protein